MVPLASDFHMPPPVARKLTWIEFAVFAQVIDNRRGEERYGA